MIRFHFIFTILFLFISWTTLAQVPSEIISRQINEARDITQSWLNSQKKGISKKDIFAGQAERADYIISGIPKFIKAVDPKGVIYRHYTGKATQIILETSQLKTGITPYIVMNPGFSREVYEDLVGIFLTTPQTPPEKVGLPRNPNADYIDFTLYEGTPVIEIEKEILLIPGRPDVPGWLKSLYEDYKTTGRYDPHYLEIFKKIDQRGGINPSFMKVKILKYRQNGKIYNL
jgi:hypothetical protein